MNNTDFIQLEEDDEIDFAELFFVLKKNIIAIALCAIIGATAAFAYTINFMTPIYTSSSMIYIFSKTTSITTAADLQLGSQLTVDFEILGTSRPVLEKVIMNLGLDTTYEDLLHIVDIENPKDSRIIRITVENPDPESVSPLKSNSMRTPFFLHCVCGFSPKASTICTGEFELNA
jgi:capsular polysaccharide biosynthesis protein